MGRFGKRVEDIASSRAEYFADMGESAPIDREDRHILRIANPTYKNDAGGRTHKSLKQRVKENPIRKSTKWGDDAGENVSTRVHQIIEKYHGVNTAIANGAFNKFNKRVELSEKARKTHRAEADYDPANKRKQTTNKTRKPVTTKRKVVVKRKPVARGRK